VEGVTFPAKRKGSRETRGDSSPSGFAEVYENTGLSPSGREAEGGRPALQKIGVLQGRGSTLDMTRKDKRGRSRREMRKREMGREKRQKSSKHETPSTLQCLRRRRESIGHVPLYVQGSPVPPRGAATSEKGRIFPRGGGICWPHFKEERKP